MKEGTFNTKVSGILFVCMRDDSRWQQSRRNNTVLGGFWVVGDLVRKVCGDGPFRVFAFFFRLHNIIKKLAVSDVCENRVTDYYHPHVFTCARVPTCGSR